jgi:hypothetical protein
MVSRNGTHWNVLVAGIQYWRGMSPTAVGGMSFQVAPPSLETSNS